MNLNLQRKRVLVTGSTRGIGLASAKGFLKEKAKVILTSRNPLELREIARSLGEEYGSQHILHYVCDFTNNAQISALKEYIVAQWHGLDILVLNVGSGVSVPDAVPPKSHLEEIFSKNLYGAIDSVREFLPLLEASKGNMLFVASIAGLEAFGAPVYYSIAKTALIAFSKNIARKIAPQNVRANCVAPGNVYFKGGNWDNKLQNDPGVENTIKNQVPMKRFGRPEEIADAILFLTSERASFITGSCLIVDGGQTTVIF